MNTIHLFDQSIVCEERAECGLYSKSFPMSGPSFDGSWLYPGHCQMEPPARESPLLEPGGACTGGSPA